MRIEAVPIESIYPDPSNVRQHPVKNLNPIKSSLKRFGQQKPIVVTGAGMILAGNGTWEAAIDLKWKAINIVRSKLDSLEGTAYAIADNRSGELADWDYEGLSKILSKMQSDNVLIDNLGWDEHELAPLLNAEWQPEEPNKKEFSRDDLTSIKLTKEQWATFKRAAAIARGTETEMTDGECLVRICSTFIGSIKLMRKKV